MKVKTSLLTLILCSTAMLPTAVLSSPAAVAAACTALNFKAARTYAAGTNPRSVAHADFDADGDLDLAVANYGSHNVSVLDGDGAGNFAPPSNVQAGTNPREVTVADFNGDGRPDLITANERSSSLSVILNAGGGAFGAAQTVGVGAFPHSVAVADYNSDGKLDLVVGYGGSSFISMLLGDGAGNFAPPTQHSLTSHIGAHQLGAADFNADGKTDVFVVLASGGADNLAVLLGDGAGGLGEPKISLGGSNAVHGIAGDFNADGKVDVVTADSRPTSTGPVALMLGDGAGRFAFPLQFTAGGNPMAVAAGDFDGDSKTDLVAANEISNGVSFLAGTGGAGADAFAPAKHFGVGTDPTALTVADFNRDGRPDIVSANHASNDVSVVLNRGGGDFAATLNLPVRLNPWGMASADFNGDGRADLATANSSDNSISLLFAQGAGGFAPSVRVAAPGPRWLAAA
ncbi:MAG TPA: VCBS repeat-containing protein, partial [Pyrinomonadaceae bacterium]